MTSGERMVFAAGFIASMRAGACSHDAAVVAAAAVVTLRAIPRDKLDDYPEARAMLDDMLGVPR